ncbi:MULTISPECIES: NAD(P)/FAD-dependent oxidoreductase [Streptosporangium]|uniref:3-phenylpropionate/trans-cinnamate dioxygenase ferredoxin reductase subunit n=1 Tax=Streptosporangium brasiliense TaxID=47480 RepID=A0ABT9QWC3_9ACTN|nr:FAD-dependent oxidoreductase [Streptosporangium brasiliense]MDP9860976.1 3-phenylpropionate/trans-cinnamate dioxygenase ferredoxin reductase subunit [Streptosporangium brasiliense]
MTTEQTFVIVGAGLAGAKAAQSLREEGFTGRITLIGAEAERPYERPPLSKGYLLGKEEKAKVYVHDEGWYGEHSVELLTGRRVTGIDRSGHEVELDDGRRLGYAKLLLAPGASPRRLDVPGADLDGVHYLRSLDDSERLRGAVRGGGRVVVVGAGWIGLETAAAARGYGCEVTVVEPRPVPLQAALGPEMGAFFAEVHRRQGVDVRLGRGVTGFRGDGRVQAVLTDDGGEIPADVVIVGVGVRPEVELAERAGLAVDNGIVVDESLRTDDPDIYAAGDAANAFNPLYGARIRVEHWSNALNGGLAAGRAMLGQKVVYDRPPYFFTDQYDVGMEFSGWFAPGGYDSVVVRGDLEARDFHAFWLAGGRVVAGMHVNRWEEGIAPVQELIRGGAPVAPDRLADPSVPFADLVRG